ncbi:MAG: aminomethyltransferase beta-barrel domain-containing protein, partial [Bdellovibrionales bacterium]
DQTYFLFTIDPSVVPRLLFPVGGMKKPEVREYCEKRGLRVDQKKDSTGICFVGNMGYGKFIESQVPQEILKSKSGLIKRYPSGEIMGEHSGIHHFTIGQGKGLGLTHHEKLFVIKVDVETHTVWVGSEEHLFSEQALVVDSQFISELKADEVVGVKIRYQHKPSLAQVKFNTQGQIELKFIEPQRAVTPGQAAVFYRGHQLLGGGWIKS